MEVRQYDRDGIHYAEDVIPPGWVVLAEYTPCHSVTPWDYYGLTWFRPRLRALENSGIQCGVAETRKTNLYPSGTGPRDSVRFGDAMMPHDYKIVVTADQIEPARQVLMDLETAIRDWLDGKRTMPDELR